MNTKRTARAIAYAARMAHLIDSYGHTWEGIEATTKSILEGHPVPPDNQTVDVSYTGALVEPVSPGVGDDVEQVRAAPVSIHTEVSSPLELINELLHTQQCLVNVREQRNQLNDEIDGLRQELENVREALRIESKTASDVRADLKVVHESNTYLGAELVNARAIAEQLRRDNTALRWTRSYNLGARIKELEEQLKGSELCRDQLRRDLVATADKRDAAESETKKLRQERDTWASTAEFRQESVRRLEAEKDLALRSRDTWRETARNTANERDAAVVRNKELEECNVELRQQLESLGNELARAVRDRDSYNRGAAFWMQSSKEQQAKVEKLRTFLQQAERYDTTFMYVDVQRILEETK